MKCILGLAKPDRLGLDTAYLKGAKVNFFGSRTLAPVSVHKPSAFG